MADMDATDPRPAEAEPSSRPNVLAQLWQRRGVFTVTFATAFVLVVCLLFVLPVGYVASGSIIVGDREPLMGSSSAAWVQKIGDPADMESNILLIRSPRLIRTLLAEPGMSDAVEADCEAVSRQLLTRLRPIDCSRVRQSGGATALGARPLRCRRRGPQPGYLHRIQVARAGGRADHGQ